MVSHIGKNTGSGHYVSHLKKDGKWVIFNDEKVALSSRPPFEHAYVYLFQRKDTIGSPHPDYYPFVSKDETVMVFTSRRPEGKGSKEFDGYYPSDIWVVNFKGLNFTPAKSSGSLNTAYDEQAVGIYDDGRPSIQFTHVRRAHYAAGLTHFHINGTSAFAGDTFGCTFVGI